MQNFQLLLIIKPYQNKVAKNILALYMMINSVGSLFKKLVKQLCKSCGMLYKLKHHTNISVLKAAYFALFIPILLTRHFTGEDPIKLLLITLQKIAVKTLKYKYKVWNVTVLFKLFVAKFVHSFDNGELPKHFDNCFSDIASVTHIKQGLNFFLKYYLPRMKASLGQLSLSILDPKFGLILLKTWNLYHLIHLEKITKISSYLLNIPVEFRFVCSSLVCNIVFSVALSRHICCRENAQKRMKKKRYTGRKWHSACRRKVNNEWLTRADGKKAEKRSNDDISWARKAVAELYSEK